jgi:hypothetical protein
LKHHDLKDTKPKMAPKAPFERITSVRIGESDWDIPEDETKNNIESLMRHIGFSPAVHIMKIMPRYEYTAKEMKACWYTPEDKAKMNGKHENIVARFESGKSPRRGQTYRGLECWSVESARELEATISRCIYSVMDEQDRQWRLFSDDYDELSAVSMRTSGPSKQLAREMAQLDTQAVAPLVVAPAVTAMEEGGDVSSSETGSDALNDIPVPVPKKERRRSEKNSKSHTKKGRWKDPPGNILRDASQNASDALKQMAGASRKFSIQRVITQESPIRGQGLGRTRSK